MNETEFSYIFDRIVKSNTSIPSDAIMSILAGIVRTSSTDSEEIKKFAEAIKDMPLEEAVSKTVLFTCNSVIMNIWKIYGKQIEEAYDKINAESAPAEDSERKDA